MHLLSDGAVVLQDNSVTAAKINFSTILKLDTGVLSNWTGSTTGSDVQVYTTTLTGLVVGQKYLINVSAAEFYGSVSNTVQILKLKFGGTTVRQWRQAQNVANFQSVGANLVKVLTASATSHVVSVAVNGASAWTVIEPQVIVTRCG